MPLDDDDKKAIGEMIKGALTGEDFAKGIAKAVEGQVAKAVKAVDFGKSLGEVLPKLLEEKVGEKVAAIAAELKPAAGSQQGGAAGQQGQGAGVKDDPEFKKLTSQIAELERLNKDAAKRAEESESRRKSELLNNSIRDALVAGGADAKRIQFALPVLLQRGIAKLDDDGRPTFVLKRDWGDENVDLEKGAREWLQTEEGKFFVPASGKQGTGDKVETPRSGTPRAKDGKVDWSQLAGRINLGVIDSLE